MTSDRAAVRALPGPAPRPGARAPRPWLSLLVVVAIAVATFQSADVRADPLLLALAVLSVGGWAASIGLPDGRLRTTVHVLMALLGAVGAGLGAAELVAPLIGGVLLLIGRLRSRTGFTATVVAIAVLTTSALCWATGRAPSYVLAMLGAVAFGVLIGVLRRSRRAADLRERELLARSLAAEQDAARSRLLEERQAVARDVHDVLAHGLGGLVVQLDAIEALLEHGRTAEAAERAEAARRLAGESLAEARRAVAALRDPEAVRPVEVPDSALEDLIAAHRALGGAVEVAGDLRLDGLDGPHREALARALQEALSNVRRHAPGEAVRVAVRREPGALLLEVRSRLRDTGRSTVGGGHGLIGMRERFAALDDGSTVRAGAEGDAFVVSARAVVP